MSKKDKYNLICRYCGISFYNSNKNKLYCSTECKEKDKKIEICSVCGSYFIKNTKFQKYCCDNCRNYVKYKNRRKKNISDSKNQYNGAENVDFVECKICGQRMTYFNPSHLKMHNISKEEYKQKYGIFVSYPSKYIESNMNGENNPNSIRNTTSQDRKERSPFSKEFYKKRGISEQARAEFIKKIAENRTYNTQLNYYLNKGLDELSAKKALSNRQRTCGGGSYSSISQRFISEILEDSSNLKKFFYGKNEKKLSYKDGNQIKYFRYDLTNEESKRIIEFNGDFWHGNPTLYKSNDYNPVLNKSYEEIKKYDNFKSLIAFNAGYSILTIWESDYLQNHDDVIIKCKDFILS